jgi:hypothetical protein
VAELVEICKEEDKLLKTLKELDGLNNRHTKPASQDGLRNLLFGGGDCKGFIQKVVERSVNLLVRDSKGMIEKTMLREPTIDVEKLKHRALSNGGNRQSKSVEPRRRIAYYRELAHGTEMRTDCNRYGILPEARKEQKRVNINTLPYRFMSPSV